MRSLFIWIPGVNNQPPVNEWNWHSNANVPLVVKKMSFSITIWLKIDCVEAAPNKLLFLLLSVLFAAVCKNLEFNSRCNKSGVYDVDCWCCSNWFIICGFWVVVSLKWLFKVKKWGISFIYFSIITLNNYLIIVVV